MATIIKSGTAQHRASAESIQPVAFSFGDMGQQADRYLDEVRRQAAQIVQKAHQEAEQHRRRAEEEGRKAAQAAIEQLLDDKVAKKMQTLLPALQESIAQIQHAKVDWMRHWEQSAVKVAAEIAGRLIRRPLAETPEITLDLVREALNLAPGTNTLTLRLHPTDHANLGPHVKVLVAELSNLASATVVADPTIELGGCRVDTEFGTIDQQFHAQMERIAQELA